MSVSRLEVDYAAWNWIRIFFFLLKGIKKTFFFFLNHKVREDELIIHQSGEKVVADENIFFFLNHP